MTPKGAEARAPLPLVVFFHPPDELATSVDKATSLRKLGTSLDLSGDPAHLGFVVLAPQGRALGATGQGASFDADYTGADNADVATVDHFVEELLAKGLVDRRRIYAFGMSLSGRMAATYAMVRADRVAALGVYGSDAPRASWSCPGPPPPAFVLYRACDDVVACDSVERWLRARDSAGAETRAIRLGGGDEEEPNCAVKNQCTKKRAAGRHRVWPRGREEELLRFLGAHTLGVDPSR
jgi:poly(3-hydroxybutyrate) depolymerase